MSSFRIPLLSALALLAASWPSASQAAFVKGPFLQHATQTSMVVSWQSENAAAGTVDYGGSTSLGQQASTSLVDAFQEVELTGLTPSTVYYYQVTADGQTSSMASFVTAPQDEAPFAFAVVGDTRTDGDEHQAVIDRLLATIGAPDLVINTGDLVEDGGDYSQWDEFFTIEHELMAQSPLYPVAGNHDDVENDSYYVQYFNLPESSSATENWYAFTYGNTRFITVDTNEDFVTGSEQYDWLEGELASASSDAAIQHIVVSFHDPPYTSGAHGVFDPDDWEPPRTYLVPLFTSYGVDVVFNGHDHHYERSDVSQTDGVLYIVAGGGGAPGAPEDFVEGIGSIVKYLGMAPDETVGQYLEDNDWLIEVLSWFVDGPDEYELGWWRAYAEVVKHFVYVEVAGDYMSATVYNVDGGVVDSWTIGSYDGDEVDDDADGYTEYENDCNDADDTINPGATDECDGVDNDCDGQDNGCEDPDPDDTGSPDDKDTDDEDPDDENPDDGDQGDDPGDSGDKGEGGSEGCGCASSPTMAPWALSLLVLGLAARRRRSAP